MGFGFGVRVWSLGFNGLGFNGLEFWVDGLEFEVKGVYTTVCARALGALL